MVVCLNCGETDSHKVECALCWVPPWAFGNPIPARVEVDLTPSMADLRRQFMKEEPAMKDEIKSKPGSIGGQFQFESRCEHNHRRLIGADTERRSALLDKEAAIVKARIRAMGLEAENDMRRLRGSAPAYSEVAFNHIIGTLQAELGMIDARNKPANYCEADFTPAIPPYPPFDAGDGAV